MNRHDYGFPFRINSASGQAAQSTYSDHVDQMIRQILLTSPGERADLPDFGCGLRQLVFAPHSQALDATTKIQIQKALGRWLSDQITVQQIQVAAPVAGQEEQLQIEIDYTLIETQSQGHAVILVS
jgi:hypothetical protein